MRKNPTYMALLGPTRLLISEKSATYTIKWSYTIIWQVRVVKKSLQINSSQNAIPPFYFERSSEHLDSLASVEERLVSICLKWKDGVSLL